MVAKNGLLFAALLAFSMLSAVDVTGVGDWDGQLSINGALAADGTELCVFVNSPVTENDITTIGAETSGYYLLHAVAGTGDNVSFYVFCDILYPVNENPQNWSASPPRHHLNLTINHTIGPVLTRIAPATTGISPGTVTMTVSTNESATCRYSTTSGVAYASMSAATTSTLGTTHSWSVSASAYSTTYTYYLRCIDQFNMSSSEFSLAFTTTSSGGGGGGNSGGGSTGGGGATTSHNELNYSVDIGSGRECTIQISRSISSSSNLSVLTTTLDNVDCTLENFTFNDTIPSNFTALNISFSPMYTARDGWRVSFNFPSFTPGESRVLTYTVYGWVPPSRLDSFTNYTMTANAQAAAPQQPSTNVTQNQTQPSTNATQNATAGTSQSAIDAATLAIANAKAAGKDTSAAERELANARSAFGLGDYERAMQLANNAKYLAGTAPAKPSTQVQPTGTPTGGNDWLVILGMLLLVVLVGGAILLGLFGKKKRGLEQDNLGHKQHHKPK